MSEVIWPPKAVQSRYEVQWHGGLSGEWWHYGWYKRRFWAKAASVLLLAAATRVIDHGVRDAEEI